MGWDMNCKFKRLFFFCFYLIGYLSFPRITAFYRNHRFIKIRGLSQKQM